MLKHNKKNIAKNVLRNIAQNKMRAKDTYKS